MAGKRDRSWEEYVQSPRGAKMLKDRFDPSRFLEFVSLLPEELRDQAKTVFALTPVRDFMLSFLWLISV